MRRIPAVQFRVVRVIPEQVIRRQVVGDAAQSAVEVVTVHDSQPVGVVGERAKRFNARRQAGTVRGERDRLARAHREVERREAARIDRIEADVVAVRQVHDLPEVVVVVHRRQVHPLAVARRLRHRLPLPRPRAAHPQLALVVHANRFAPRHRLGLPAGVHGPQVREAPVRAIQRPALADRQHRLAFLADAPRVKRPDRAAHRTRSARAAAGPSAPPVRAARGRDSSARIRSPAGPSG